MKKTIFVVGAGKGCGNHVAEKFGQNGFRVVLMARNEECLKAYEQDFKSKGIEVYTQPMDASDKDSLINAFDILKKKFGIPDVLFYNVGITTPDFLLPDGVTYEVLLDHYKADVLGAYLAIQQVIGHEFSQKRGAILVTGGGVSNRPLYQLLPLSMDKAALRAMCLALYDKLKKDNVYVGLITVNGIMAPGKSCDPEIVADDFWDIYSRRQECELIVS